MELAEYLRFFAALGVVLLLIAGLGAVVRRSGLGNRLAVAKSNGPRRLDLIEVRPLDAKRKLVLLRRDDREHLVLLGNTSDLLIESDIPAAPARSSALSETAKSETAGGEDQSLVGRVRARLRRAPS